MRIVPSLKDMDECPNCGYKHYLRETENQFGRPYIVCLNCREEIFENEYTYSEEQHTVDCITEIMGSNEAVEEQKRKKKENFIFEMREEISNLDWCSHDVKTQILVGNLQNILNKIIDYIEEN